MAINCFFKPRRTFTFFTGTYFPNEERYQLPGFKDLLQRIANFYQTHTPEIIDQSHSLQLALQQLATNNLHLDIVLNSTPLELAVKELAVNYDSHYGGFGAAPKFPNPSQIELLITDSLTSIPQQNAHESSSLNKVALTLTKMALGGIYDQIGGGFYRYSVDERWEISHFEKMLYDNAQLLCQYTLADGLQSQPLFKKIVHENYHLGHTQHAIA